MLPITTTIEHQLVVGEGGHGLRLDRFLAEKVDKYGVRGWRRMCETGLVLVNGRSAPSSLKTRTGQHIAVMSGPLAYSAQIVQEPFLVERTNDLAALYKPAGLHTASIAGSPLPSLETMLLSSPSMLQSCMDDVRILNRLDRHTSGLVMCAITNRGCELWRAAEDKGMIHKAYLALVHGLPATELTLRKELDTANRKRSKVLGSDASDALRHTRVVPLAELSELSKARLDIQEHEPVGLVACHIKKGARHQIRAHLSEAGYPLVGDTLYGGRGNGPYFLHHGVIQLADFYAACQPPWAFIAELKDSGEQEMQG